MSSAAIPFALATVELASHAAAHGGRFVVFGSFARDEISLS